MEIKCIICENKNLKAFDTTTKSFSDFKLNLYTKDTYYIIAEHNGIMYSANLNRILNKIGSMCNTWEEFTSILTVNLLLDYKKLSPVCRFMYTKINDKMESTAMPVEIIKGTVYRNKVSVKTYSFDSETSIVADFGDLDHPKTRNLSNYKFMLKDIIFRNEGDVVLDFDNTIPIINGVCTFPVVYQNELYARKSTELLQSSDNKNITLIDFSPIGSIEKIRLSECTRKTPTNSKRIEIVLPEGKTTEGKTVILVLGGRLFYPNDITVPSKRNISYVVGNRLNDIIISNRIYRKDYDNTSTMTTSLLNYYINNTVWSNTDYNNFVILIDNPDVKVSYFSIDDSAFSISTKSLNMEPSDTNHMYRNIFIVDDLTGVDGFLVRRMNRDIVDYTIVQKRSKFVIMVSPCINIVVPDLDIGYVENTSIKTYGMKLSSSGFDIVDIFISD